MRWKLIAAYCLTLTENTLELTERCAADPGCEKITIVMSI